MDRLNALIEQYLEGSASSEEVAELAECLRDPEAADFFARRSRLEAVLLVHFPIEARIEKTRTVSGLLEREIEGTKRRRAYRRARWRWAAVAASLLILSGIVWWFGLRADERPEVARNPPFKPRIQEDASEPGTIKVVAGHVQIDGRDATAAKQGEILLVVSNTPAILAMGDGSQAEMEPASQVIMQDDIPGVRQVVHLLEGAGTFKVQPGDGEFQVDTEVGRVIVLGTEFRVKLMTRTDEKERVFPGTRITALAVIVTSGVVKVDVAGKSHFLTAGQDRLFRPEREAGKGMRETLAVFESEQDGTITVRQGGDRPKRLTFPLATDAHITIDGKPATLAQLSKGATVYLQRFPDDDEVLGVRGEGATVTGMLLSIDQGNRMLTLSLPGGKETSGRQRAFSWPADVKVFDYGESKQISDLLPGMQLVLKLSVDNSRVLEIFAMRRTEKERRP